MWDCYDKKMCIRLSTSRREAQNGLIWVYPAWNGCSEERGKTRWPCFNSRQYASCTLYPLSTVYVRLSAPLRQERRGLLTYDTVDISSLQYCDCHWHIIKVVSAVEETINCKFAEISESRCPKQRGRKKFFRSFWISGPRASTLLSSFLATSAGPLEDWQVVEFYHLLRLFSYSANRL